MPDPATMTLQVVGSLTETRLPIHHGTTYCPLITTTRLQTQQPRQGSSSSWLTTVAPLPLTRASRHLTQGTSDRTHRAASIAQGMRLRFTHSCVVAVPSCGPLITGSSTPKD